MSNMCCFLCSLQPPHVAAPPQDHTPHPWLRYRPHVQHMPRYTHTHISLRSSEGERRGEVGGEGRGKGERGGEGGGGGGEGRRGEVRGEKGEGRGRGRGERRGKGQIDGIIDVHIGM